MTALRRFVPTPFDRALAQAAGRQAGLEAVVDVSLQQESEVLQLGEMLDAAEARAEERFDRIVELEREAFILNQRIENQAQTILGMFGKQDELTSIIKAGCSGCAQAAANDAAIPLGASTYVPAIPGGTGESAAQAELAGMGAYSDKRLNSVTPPISFDITTAGCS